MRVKSGATLLVAAVALAGTPAAAQTNDHVFRSWRWSQDFGAPRTMGLAGAFVAVADDSASVLYNPAGMTSVTRTEVSGAALHRLDALAGIDSLAAGTGVGFVGGTGLLSSKWAIGGYLSQPRAVSLTLAEVALPDGSLDTGWVRAKVTEWGAAAAWHPLPGLHVGARVSGSHLGLESDYRRMVAGATALRVGSASGDTRITGSLGVLLTPGRRLRLGVMLTPGASWLVERTAIDPSRRLVIDAGSEYEIRAPGTVVTGLSFEVSPRLRLIGQLDYVRYSELRSSLVLRDASFAEQDYELADGWEPRLATEASFPIGSIALQLRGGAHREASGALRFVGEDASERAAFPGSDARWRGAAGLSLVARSWSAHFGVRFERELEAATGGIALRF